MSLEIKNVLFPMDFSEFAQSALEHAKTMTRLFNATLHCLHVVDEACQYWSAMGPESIPIGPPPDEMVSHAKQRLTAYAEEHLADLDHPPVTHVAVGRPFSEIIAYSRQRDVGLIVMATHGRGAIAHVLLGSTTEKVVRKSVCPVLTVRAGKHSFEMP